MKGLPATGRRWKSGPNTWTLAEIFAVLMSERENDVKVVAELRGIRCGYACRRRGLLNDTAWILATNPSKSVRRGGEAVELAERARAAVPIPRPSHARHARCGVRGGR